METLEFIQTILFFLLGGLVLAFVGMKLLKKPITGVMFDSGAYGVIGLVSGITATYGNYLVALIILAIGVGSMYFMKRRGK